MVKGPKREMKEAKKSFKIIFQETLQKLQISKLLNHKLVVDMTKKVKKLAKETKLPKKIDLEAIKNSSKKLKDAPKTIKEVREKIIHFRKNFEMSNNLKQRIIAAAILVPFVIIILYASSFLFNGLILLIVVLMTIEWQEITKTGKDKKFWLVLGLCYIILPSLFLMTIRGMENGADIILWLFAVVWGTDTAAYFVGKNLGGPKLAPKISPNKTWSGLFGGIFASMLIGLIGALFFAGSIKFFIFFGGLLAIVEQVGDLFESKVKRIFSVKDSGAIIPGHGGVMDRVDGLLLVVPAVFLVILFSGGKIF
jgi:phosphatidate cytidylyltransferase